MFCFFVFFLNGLENKFLFSTWNKMLIKFIASAFNLPIYFFHSSTLSKHVKINEFVDLSNRPFAFIFSCFLFLIRSIRPKTRQAKKSLKNCFFFLLRFAILKRFSPWFATLNYNDGCSNGMNVALCFFEDFCAIKVPVLNIIIM